MKYILIVLLFIPAVSVSHAQPVRIVAEEWSVYSDSLGKFESSGEKLVAVEFDREKMIIKVSQGEFNTKVYAVHSIEEKEVDGQTALYWNLYDPDFLRIAFIPEMIMFIDHKGNNAMVLTKLTFLEPDKERPK